MAKFCTKCGKPLAEGEVCSCSAQQSVASDNISTSQNNANEQPVVNGQVVQQTTNNVNMEQTKNFIIELWNLILGILKSPITAGSQYVGSNDILSSIILFVIQGITTGIFVNVFVSRGISEFTSILGGVVKNSIDLQELSTVMVVLLISVALSFVYAAVLMVASLIFKVKIDLMQCIRIMGARSVFMITGTIIAIFIALLSAPVGLGISAVILPVIGYVYVVVMLKNAFGIDDNKLIYMYTVYILFAFLVYYIIAMKIGFTNLPLVKNISKGIGNLTSLLGGFSSGLGDMFK